MPKFNKSVEQLESRFDKWLYVIRNLNRLDRVPEKLREQIFEKLFEVAEIAKFTHDELMEYEESLKSYRDLQNSIDIAVEEALEKERKIHNKEKLDIVLNLINSGVSIEKIITATGLTKEEIDKLC